LAGKVIAGLVECSGSLALDVYCELTACTLGSVVNCVQPKRAAGSSNYSNVRQNASPVRSSFVTNAHFDYAEMAMDSNHVSSADNELFDYPAMAADSSDSLSHSTVGDNACWETPFAQESLGNTVIHFDTVLS